MTTTSKSPLRELQYHIQAYKFLLAALRHTQQQLGRSPGSGDDDEQAHISCKELCEGIRQFACEQFGLMAIPVFHQWGIHTTDDFGRIVFEMIERGDMRKTDRDQLSDFFDLYSFEDAFDREYQVDVSQCLS